MFLQHYCTLILNNRKRVLWLVGVLSVFFALQLLYLKVNSSPYFMPQEHESRIHELDVKALFTNTGEQILVVVKPNKGSPLDAPGIQVVSDLTAQFASLSLADSIDEDVLAVLRSHPDTAQLLTDLATLKGAKLASRITQLQQRLSKEGAPPVIVASLMRLNYLYFPIKKIRSLSTQENLMATEDEITLQPLLPAGELTPENVAEFKKQTLENPLFKGLLISEDAKVTTIQIELTIPKDDNHSTVKLYNKVREMVENYPYDGKLYLAGNPVIDAEMAMSMQRDNMVFFPFVILVIALILFACFREMSGIYVPLIIAGLTTIWTLGMMVLAGIEQNIVTTILPVFLLTVAVADAIHFYNHFLLSGARFSSQLERLLDTFKHLLRPLILTSVTTFIGFISLAWTDITYIREFGVIMAAGVLIALFLTIVLAPVLMPAGLVANDDRPRGLVQKLAQALGWFIAHIINKPVRFLVLFSLIAVAGSLSLLALEFDQENINNFDTETLLRSHNEAILQHLDGTIPIDIWIDTGQQGGIYNPQVIREIDALEAYLETTEGIGFVLSPVDFLKRMYDLLTFEGHRLPESFDAQLVAQEILVYENERSQDIKSVIDDQHRHLRLIVLGKSDAASFWGPVLAQIEAMTPTGTSLQISGYGKVMFSNIEEVITTNITSTMLALGLIALVMIILFKSFSIGLLGVLPLVLTVILNYAVMAVSGIAVDVGTTIIAAIAFGIGIDYSIHLLSAIASNRHASDSDTLKSILEASKKVAMPIMINSITLAAGFLVLVASDFLVIQLLGVFIAMTMLISAVNALILIPAFFALCAAKR